MLTFSRIGYSLDQTISGRLVNKTGSPIQANITIYENGANNIVNSTLTQDGNYFLSVPPDTYDLNYNIFNFTPNFFIKLTSLNVFSDLLNVINYVN